MVGSRLRRWGSWLALLWILVVSVRYLSTVFRSLQHPFNAGEEFICFIVWVAAAALMLGSLAVHQRIGTTLWGILISGSIVAMIVLSGVVTGALIALWITVLAVLVGYRILSVLRLSLADPVSILTVGFSLGFSALAILTLVLALAKQLTSTNAWLLIVVLSALEVSDAVSIVRTLRQWWDSWESSQFGLESRMLILLTSAAFAMNFTWNVAPEVQFDALNYHLPVPRMYLEAHGLVDLPYFFHSYFAHLAEMFFAFGMALQGEMVVKLVMAGVGLISAIAVYNLGKSMFNAQVGLWAAAFFYLTPLVSWLTGTAHTDLILILMMTSACIAFLQWHSTRGLSWMIVTGLLIGAGVGVKLNAAYAAIGFAVAFLFANLSRLEYLKKKVYAAAILILPAIIVALPWYLMTYIHTGNPVFPMLNGIFRSPRTEPVNTFMNAGSFGIGKNLPALLRIPFRLSLDSSRFGEALPAGSMGPLLLLLIPLGFIVVYKRSEARLLALIAVIYFVLWAETFQYARYYLAIFPIIAVLAVAGVDYFSTNRLVQAVSKIALSVLLIFQMPLLAIRYWNVTERFPAQIAFGLESRDAFLKRVMDGYGSTMFINRSIAPGKKVIGIDTESLRFYLAPPLETLSESTLDSPLRGVSGIRSEDDLARTLASMGFSYLLTSTLALKDPPVYYPFAQPDFLRNHARRVHSDEFTAVYELKPY
jgi:hypothetical protein